MTRPLVAAYRLQLHPEFGFRHAAAIVPYLRDLGVSHLYLSPCFEAAAGSLHGYDVVDPNRLRDELGGEAGFTELVEEAHRNELGVVLDIVPHHMSATAANQWWWSVLERGRSSPFSAHFDIDWDPPEPRLRGVVLLPVLGDHYGRVLEARELQLARIGNDIVARYHEHIAPLSPTTADELWAEAGRRGCDVNEVLDEVNADVDRLDGILNRQHHRFARWQVAAHELDYRRFFDIDSLVAMRSERPAVFDDTHRLTIGLVRSGAVEGLRVDHVDGLRDPEGYLARLRAAVPEAWITVEKILRAGESLPDTWAVDGTTGYDFLGQATRLLVDPAGVDQFTDAYGKLTGDESSYGETRSVARREAATEALAADVERVVNLLLGVCEHNRRWRDYTRAELRDALTEVCVHAPAYRSYVRPGVPPTEADVAFVSTAIEGARDARPDIDADLFTFLSDLLLGVMAGDEAVELVARFQQLSGPIAAKGEEDTAFYRWVPVLCVNEVGCDPDEAPIGVDEFHTLCTDRQRRWPQAMLTTSTHDTKRGEDVRARLAALTEHPDEVLTALGRWIDANDRFRDRAIDAPDRRDEWYLYQTLIGAHPLTLERVWPVLEKSLRESKRRTSWVRVDEEYEHATKQFVEAILADDSFRAELDAVVAIVRDAGFVNALTQTALRTLTPGVPDIYQGCELWDSSLVDPDNRRPVNYERRHRELASVAGTTVADLWATDRESGRPKLALLRECLALRARRPSAFDRDGTYEPLAVSGPDAERVIAFGRGGEVCVALPRLPGRGLPDAALVQLPPGRWRSVLTGAVHDGTVSFGELRGGAPLAVSELDLDPVL